MKKLISVVASLAVTFSVACAYAHGNAEHVMGVLKDVAADHVAVQTQDGKLVKVGLDSDTAVIQGEKRIDRTALKVGERVVVDVEGKPGSLHAEEIRIGTAHPGTEPHGADSRMQMGAMTGDADHDFAMMMKKHHEDGVKMAQDEVRDGKDPKMKKMAQDIITNQNKEIQELAEWLAGHEAMPAKGSAH
jgi:hypothetical protein